MRIGTPSNSKNCFGEGTPIRLPLPAAGMIAAILEGFINKQG